MNFFPECSLVVKLQAVKGRCAVESCNAVLPPRRRRWCSDGCRNKWEKSLLENHYWGYARKKCRRAYKYKCRDCGVGNPAKLEVNHILPRNGRKLSIPHCGNHQSNLELLCSACHRVKTNIQLKIRKKMKRWVTQ